MIAPRGTADAPLACGVSLAITLLSEGPTDIVTALTSALILVREEATSLGTREQPGEQQEARDGKTDAGQLARTKPKPGSLNEFHGSLLGAAGARP